MPPVFGILNINKPAGWTSRDVVNRVQRLVRPAKAGHAGTLDPLATGVLVVCVGPATRLIEYVQSAPKRYEATFLLGRRSETDDLERDVKILDDAPVPTRAQLDAVLPQFLGLIEQRPPAFSAVKVGGKRAYKLARQGKSVDVPLRQVRIDDLAVRAYNYPRLELNIVCGGGTYIRSLGRDLAEAVGTSAVMSDLCRTAVGEFQLQDAITVDDLQDKGVEPFLLPPATAVRHLASLVLSDFELDAVAHGRHLDRPANGLAEEIAAFDGSGRLVAILAADESGRLRPTRNFAAAS